MDVNRDGRDDLIQFGRFVLTQYLRATGDGTFAADETLDLGVIRPMDVQPTDIEQDGDLDLILSGGDAAQLFVVRNESLSDIGSTYCVFAVPNSTGTVGAIEGYGGTEVFQQDLELTVTSLPSQVFGFFLASRTDAIEVNVPGSVGTLCLGRSIGRFTGPGEVQQSGPSGVFRLDVDLMNVPAPLGSAIVAPGETWYFEAWHRDMSSTGQPTSNFTEALQLTFR